MKCGIEWYDFRSTTNQLRSSALGTKCTSHDFASWVSVSNRASHKWHSQAWEWVSVSRVKRRLAWESCERSVADRRCSAYTSGLGGGWYSVQPKRSRGRLSAGRSVGVSWNKKRPVD